MGRQFIQKIWTNHPREDSGMSSAVLTKTKIDLARDMADGIVRRRQFIKGETKDDARAWLARMIGVAPGTLYNLARNRLKRLDADLRDGLTAFAIRDLQSEIKRLSHDLELAEAMGVPRHGASVARIEERLKTARELLAEAGL